MKYYDPTGNYYVYIDDGSETGGGLSREIDNIAVWDRGSGPGDGIIIAKDPGGYNRILVEGMDFTVINGRPTYTTSQAVRRLQAKASDDVAGTRGFSESAADVPVVFVTGNHTTSLSKLGIKPSKSTPVLKAGSSTHEEESLEIVIPGNQGGWFSDKTIGAEISASGNFAIFYGEVGAGLHIEMDIIDYIRAGETVNAKYVLDYL